MKRKIINALLLSALTSLTSCQSETSVSLCKFTFADMDEDVLPISGWIAPSSVTECNTLEQYKILKESGLNTIYAHYETYGDKRASYNIDGKVYDGTEEIYKALSYAEEVGVKYFVRDAQLFALEGEAFNEAFKSRNYTAYSSFAGFHYMDEPQTQEQFDNIASAYKKFKQYVPSKYAFYVNLNPMSLYTGQGKTIYDYQDYIIAYANTVNPRFLSYDHYAPKNDFPYVKSDYFANLSIFSETANELGLPFWAFALASAHYFPYGGWYYRTPTEADIYWQVNTVLAYGAKALQYFCYQTPVGTEPNEVYIGRGGSIVNEKGEKSEIFPYIQKINKFVAFIDHILMNSTKIGLVAYEESPACYLYEDYYESYKDIKKLETENDVFISIFKYKNKYAYYVVNNSLVNDANFTIKFKNPINYKIYTMDLTTDTYKSKSFTSQLKPGEGLLIEKL